ncbi:unnamed protein product [Cyprideis torosa]|uniref:Uncharacterized protein n=1 Tax=Cyprideis torosa TaxID=163714 RepID=A0A7R8WFS5_9CRUS|nr:unnamed protein product [Cyprideis torosa]CAG0890951.1 unnamed protein product [Cyprideis torosa]
MMDRYSLVVSAVDDGIPPQSANVTVVIDVSDVNDCPPTFDQVNQTGIIQEDKPLNHPILTFRVSDLDLPPNAGPFSFDILSGNEGLEFRLGPDGTLRSATKFDHSMRKEYVLKVRVYDHGSPPLHQDTFVTIKVIEESMFPPVVSPLTSFVTVPPGDAFPGGVVGAVRARDGDPYDKLSFQLTAPSSSAVASLFEIGRSDGLLTAFSGLDAGEYEFNVSVTDGKFLSVGEVRVVVTELREEMLSEAVTVTLRAVTPHGFVTRYRKAFMRALSNSVGGDTRAKDIAILSVTKSPSRKASSRVRRERRFTDATDVLCVAGKGAGSDALVPAAGVREAALSQAFQRQLGLEVLGVSEDGCAGGIVCLNGGHCEARVRLAEGEGASVIQGEGFSMVGVRYDHVTQCRCKTGFTGRSCEQIANACAHDPCPSYQECVPDLSLTLEYHCRCPEGFTGPRCKVSRAGCENCYIPLSPMTFSGASLARYRLLHPIEDKVFVDFKMRSTWPRGTILMARGSVDYAVLEVVSGHVVFRWALGSGEGQVRVGSLRVDDGEWHDVSLERRGAVVELRVDGRWTDTAASPGRAAFLDMEEPLVLVGGGQEFPSTPPFHGCLDHLRLNRAPLPTRTEEISPVARLEQALNIGSGCPQEGSPFFVAPGVCALQPCRNGGKCFLEDEGSKYRCECSSDRFSGRDCQIDRDPCASSPCLNGGICQPSGATFRCECPHPRLSGQRCEMGFFCNPNPCERAAFCEEGVRGPRCQCRGFAGPLCSLDVNECLNSPCGAGATCINTPGAFEYNRAARSEEEASLNGAPPNIKVSPPANNFKQRGNNGVEMTTFVAAPRDASATDAPLNQLNNFDHVYSYDEEPTVVGRPVGDTGLPTSPRAAPIGQASSQTPALGLYDDSFKKIQNDLKANNGGLHFPKALNVRLPSLSPEKMKYAQALPHGSSGRTSPAGYQARDRTSPLRTTPSLASPEDLPGEGYAFSSFRDVKAFLDSMSPSSRPPPDLPPPMTNLGPPRNVQNGRLPNSEYHWDCSDWAAKTSPPLPNISELNRGEAPDASSYHSNESNASRRSDERLPPIGSSPDVTLSPSSAGGQSGRSVLLATPTNPATLPHRRKPLSPSTLQRVCSDDVIETFADEDLLDETESAASGMPEPNSISIDDVLRRPDFSDPHHDSNSDCSSYNPPPEMKLLLRPRPAAYLLTARGGGDSSGAESDAAFSPPPSSERREGVGQDSRRMGGVFDKPRGVFESGSDLSAVCRIEDEEVEALLGDPPTSSPAAPAAVRTGYSTRL